jgi:hypothetical protein
MAPGAIVKKRLKGNMSIFATLGLNMFRFSKLNFLEGNIVKSYCYLH